MTNKYNFKDLIYDFAYVAVFIGIALFIIGSYPGIFNSLLSKLSLQ